MSEGRTRVVAVVGPTAAGKTDLAATLAREFDGEVVSVDSRQVYRRLDIGTAKPSRRLREEVPHHLVDVIEPDEAFDVSRYCALAHAAVEDIAFRRRTVFLCGGTGFYLRALTEGLCAAPGADQAMRSALAREQEERGLSALWQELQSVDPVSASRIASTDAVRILRALEVARLSGKPLSQWQQEHAFSNRPYEVMILVVSPPVSELDERIVQRTKSMWESGLLEETQEVLRAGFSPQLPALQAIGYREAQRVLREEWNSHEAIDAICLQTRRYAKRQRTWFRGLEAAHWLERPDEAAEWTGPVRDFLLGRD